MSTRPTLRIDTTSGLLAAIPYLVGFVPENSLVALAAPPGPILVRLSLRYDLPGHPGHDEAAAIAAHLAGVAAREHLPTLVLAGYGPGPLVTPVIDAARAAAAGDGLDIREALRVHEGRYWSCLCPDPACCPAGGLPVDTSAGHAAATAARLAGLPPPLAIRADLAATLAPLSGPAARAMDAATRRAERTAARITARDGATALYRPGLAAVAHAIGAYRDGGDLRPPARHAWLSVVLARLRIRDDAWARMDPAHARHHLRLWTGTLRHARPGYAAAPASLLAFTAWQLGEGALANLALDRALDDTPGYTMATLLRDAINAGVSPAYAIPPLTPEQVTNSYMSNEPPGPGPVTP